LEKQARASWELPDAVSIEETSSGSFDSFSVANSLVLAQEGRDIQNEGVLKIESESVVHMDIELCQAEGR